jgi:predicted ATPase
VLLVTVNGQDPGAAVGDKNATELSLRLQGEAISAEPLERIEIVWNGEIQQRISQKNERSENAYSSRIDATLRAKGNGWVAVRCVGRQTEAGGLPFAHTAPWYVQLAGPPLKPRRAEVEYFLQRVEQEIERNRTVLNSEQLADYYRARDFWRAKLDKLSESASDEKNSGAQ